MRAQSLFEELGEMADVQQLMRQQASLYLAAAIHANQRGAAFERAASSRLKLALRWYGRAMAPSTAAGATPYVLRCAAEAHLELARFYAVWTCQESMRSRVYLLVPLRLRVRYASAYTCACTTYVCAPRYGPARERA